MAIILCDVDDVVLDLVTVWLEVWSSENGKLVTKDQIKTWDISKYTSPDIYKYLKEKDLYYPVEPIPGAVKSITYLKNLGNRVIFATMSQPEIMGVKYGKLKELGLITSTKDYVECGDKSMLRGDVMIDDNPDNLKGFSGFQILFTQPWNEVDYKQYHRANNWDDVINYSVRGFRE